jgi:hypothetical protein
MMDRSDAVDLACHRLVAGGPISKVTTDKILGGVEIRFLTGCLVTAQRISF